MDVLATVGIYPDGIVGHSVGELGCAYADGTLTAQQTVLAAYSRGRAILDSKLPPGAMAAVGESLRVEVKHFYFSCGEKHCLYSIFLSESNPSS